MKASSCNHSWPTRMGALLLCLIAFSFFLWPIYRVHLNTILDDSNEGWNAYFADAAMGRFPLYPSPDKLITNNYPPLSFYINGALGRLTGDNVISGRILSLIGVMGVTAAIGGIVISMGCDAFSASVGAAYFLLIISRFYTRYVGMNDPQLFAQGIMAFACLWFLQSAKHERSCVGSVLLMVLAGFFKHNIVAMPLAAMLWLAIHNRSEFFKCSIIALISIIAGFGACCAIYGRDFLHNFCVPRGFSLADGFSSCTHLRWIAVGLLIWVYAGWKLRDQPRILFVNLLVITGLVISFIQQCGEGVDYNAEFDLLIGVSIGMGTAFGNASVLPLAKYVRPEYLKMTVFMAIFISLALLHSLSLNPIKSLRNGSLWRLITESQRAMERSVEKVRNTQGDVVTDPMVSYRAGKNFFWDSFNSEERIDAGSLPEDTLKNLYKIGKATEVIVDPSVYILQ